MKRINFLFVMIGMFALSGIMFGCETPTEADLAAMNGQAVVGGIDLSVSSSALTMANIDTATAVIYSSKTAYESTDPDIADPGVGVNEVFPITVTMTCSAGVCTGSASDIPSGDGRYVVANAFEDGNADPIFTGTAVVNVVAGGTASVSVLMHETTPPELFENTAPLITGLSVSDRQIATDEDAYLTVTATDPDPSNALTFTWTFSGDGGNGISVISTEQSATGATQTIRWSSSTVSIYGLSLVVTDGKSLATTVSFADLIEVYGVGTVDVDLNPNSAPQINYLITDPALMASGAVTSPEVNFTDTDSSSWTYAWTTTCDGSFDDPTLDLPDLTLNMIEYPEDGSLISCTIGVVITDDATNTASAVITVFIGPPDFVPVEETPYTPPAK